MAPRPKLLKQVRDAFSDDRFLGFLGKVEGLVAKVLSLAMLLVILASVYDLTTFLFTEFIRPDFGRFGVSLLRIFGLFLNVLVALEILENITAYLKKHVIQVELVISTSLIAVARKIIILDLEKTGPLELLALAAAIFALSVSYWVIKRVNHHRSDDSH